MSNADMVLNASDRVVKCKCCFSTVCAFRSAIENARSGERRGRRFQSDRPRHTRVGWCICLIMVFSLIGLCSWAPKGSQIISSVRRDSGCRMCSFVWSNLLHSKGWRTMAGWLDVWMDGWGKHFLWRRWCSRIAFGTMVEGECCLYTHSIVCTEIRKIKFLSAGTSVW